MTKMSDLKSEYINEPGYYDCTVIGHKLIQNNNTGNPGVQFNIATDAFEQSTVTCWLTQKALFKLAQFANHCGISDDEINMAYCINNGRLPDPNAQGHIHFPDVCHKVFHGRKVRVKIEKDGQYHNVTQTMLAQGPLPQYQQPVMSRPTSAPQPQQTAMVSDLPF